MAFSVNDLKKKATAAINSDAGRIAATTLGGGLGTIATGASIYEEKRQDKITASKNKEIKAQAEAKALSDRYETARAADREGLSSVLREAPAYVSTPSVDPFWRDKQQSLVGTLEARAKGEGPSLAQMQFQQAGNTALQKSLGAIRAATGANPALAGRTAALATTNLMGNLAAESGMARLKEQQDSQAALASLLAQGQGADLATRGQDLSVAKANADLIAQNQALRTGVQSGLLSNTENYFGNIYGRGAAQQANSPGKGDNTLGALSTAGGAILGAYGTGGTPQGAAAGAATGKTVAEGLSLRNSSPDTKKPSYALNPRRGR